VLAVDLSAASLAYARRRADELGIGNVEFLQADLLDLGRLDRHFDVIESVGVLHHLAEPAAGWRVLRGLLAPGGFMKVGLYSELARRSVVAARALIAARGDPPTVAGIRAARAAIMALPADAPARGVVASGDFYSTSGVRDLLFHVQEHRFTLPEVAALIDRLGLEFLGFVLDDEVLRDYREAEPGDPAGVSLTGWARYEDARPGTFGEMYQFWLRDAAG
jgi:SAM-dependent methyltransferase